MNKPSLFKPNEGGLLTEIMGREGGVENPYDFWADAIHDAWIWGDVLALDQILTYFEDLIVMAPASEDSEPNVWALIYEYAVAAMERVYFEPDDGPRFDEKVYSVIGEVAGEMFRDTGRSVYEDIEARAFLHAARDRIRMQSGKSCPAWVGNRTGWLN